MPLLCSGGSSESHAVAAADGFAYQCQLVVWHRVKGQKESRGHCKTLAWLVVGMDVGFDRGVGLKGSCSGTCGLELCQAKEVGIDQQHMCSITAVALPCTYRAV